jgi:hypothetical protein
MSAISARTSMNSAPVTSDGRPIVSLPPGAGAWDRARAQADAAVNRARLVVVPHRGPVSAPRLPFVMLVSVVLVGGIVGLLCFNTQMQQSSFAAATLEQRAASLTARQQTLTGELEALRDPQHLAVLAAKAGMVSPQNACTMRIGGATSGECTPATRGTTPSPFEPRPAKPRVLTPAPVVVQVAAPATTTDDDASDPGRRPGRGNNADRARAGAGRG